MFSDRRPRAIPTAPVPVAVQRAINDANLQIVLTQPTKGGLRVIVSATHGSNARRSIVLGPNRPDGRQQLRKIVARSAQL